MNRLILIGNGFDLAHDFKTGYKDFIFDYFQNALKVFYLKKVYKDELFELSYGGAYTYDYKEEPKLPSTIEEIKSTIEDYLTPPSGRMVKVNVVFHSAFFKSIYNSCSDLGWVDIENKYFEHLVSNKSGDVKLLNNDFKIITLKLEEYLLSLKIDDEIFNENNFSRVFLDPILKDDVVTVELEKDKRPNDMCILNFNYTSTVKKYLSDFKIQRTLQNEESTLLEIYIHGELGNEDNPIVFGFGDERDKDFLNFEDLKKNDLFTHIKSFWYSQTSNYHNLIRFIESDDFQVYIIGHSCGLSDRTMLNHIFEHERCKSIKMFYHKRNDGTDDFTEKTFNIYRHFKDKGMMRLKLVPKDKSYPLPKPNR